jgi:phage terminase large subunit
MVQRVGNYWHMLPEQAQARKAIWDATNPHTGKRRIDEAFPLELRESTRNDEMMIRFKNGSSWQVVGSDNYNSLVGSTPIGVVFSEWAIAKPEAWAYLRPILAENGGWALFITTTRGKNHAFQMYQTVKDSSDWFCQLLPANVTGVFAQEQLDAELKEYIGQYGDGVGRALFNQEYFCSFDSAVVGAVYGDEMHKARTEKRICSVPYEKESLVHTVWDIGYGDSTAIWFVQKVGREVHLIDYYEDSGKDIAHYVQVLNQRGYTYGTDWLPHDAEAGELGTGKSIKEMLEGLGRSVEITPKLSPEEGINAARMLMSRCYWDEQKTQRGIDCLTNYRWDVDKTTKELKPRPVHDWASHGADAFRYLAVANDHMGSAKWSGTLNYRSRVTA